VKHTSWRYALAGLTIAAIAAVVSYNDGLFVARLAGNHDHQAYLYPFLPDGLFVIGLLALVEGARMVPPQRSPWAWTAVLLGITMSAAMNVGAGIAHSVLDAFLDGMVPVVLLVAVEVVLWHVRRGRGVPARAGSPGSLPATSRGTVPSSAVAAAEARMREAGDRDFRYSNEQAAAEFQLTRKQVTEARRRAAASPPAGTSPPPPGHPPVPAGASPNGRAGG
jgi:hypothetical protein